MLTQPIFHCHGINQKFVATPKKPNPLFSSQLQTKMYPKKFKTLFKAWKTEN